MGIMKNLKVKTFKQYTATGTYDDLDFEVNKFMQDHCVVDVKSCYFNGMLLYTVLYVELED